MTWMLVHSVLLHIYFGVQGGGPHRLLTDGADIFVVGKWPNALSYFYRQQL